MSSNAIYGINTPIVLFIIALIIKSRISNKISNSKPEVIGRSHNQDLHGENFQTGN